MFNPKNTKKQRQYLRNHMTRAEIALWSRLKGKQFLGYKFRRQYGIDKYIVDFYCTKLRLVIEIDGDPHFFKRGIIHDSEKEKFLNDKGINIVRFTNDDILNNLDGVLDFLAEYIKKD